jgi:hypothetical protein
MSRADILCILDSALDLVGDLQELDEDESLVASEDDDA